ncbi:TPA: cell division protein FtsA [candidate division CPR2 bacterium]|uniref:Cell division protein FtsA n=1 Tax=candidate division CPR2 bacterium GW2011_GWC1_41_48 TaxID=1618344 RepID=A0A0G0YJG2_UNCC2|nr:MAG: Cell division protein ftsA [candidate division CPR2 bacterium GW2011_GWC2_39_35]KKS09656.1 MAG: cell division protein FtsA, cell division protein FtsA [candidate division CPR2 bacterium GW2011_GWC1_41_48]HBG81451.1 cell division protein FtsA [candidate division CPR2 bacterium]HCL99584.1 cell division protein FtsA [candidate division CPR2 bacterium]
MTPKEQSFAGIDIGSTKVNIVVGVIEYPNTPSIVGVGTYPTSGIRKGVVIDVEETVSSISSALELAERSAGVPITQASINIDGSHVASLNSRGVIAVGRADSEITFEDTVRAEEAAQAISLPSNKEIIHVIPREYSVDSQTGIKDPIGMSGVRLEVEAHIITGSQPAIRNLLKCINQAGISAENQIVTPLAAAKAMLSKRQKELGSVLVDIGGGTTGIAIFEEGNILYSAILPIGSGHITNDIAIGLRTSVDIAEKVKLKYGYASPQEIPEKEKIDLSEFGGEGMTFRRQVAKIVEARLKEILDLVRDELRRINKDGMLPGGVVITGGGANMPGLAILAKHMLKLPCEIGEPKGIHGLIDKVSGPEHATALGLMLYSMDKQQTYGANDKLAKAFDGIKKLVKIFLP